MQEQKTKQKPTLCVVIPCYNEQDVLPTMVPRFIHLLKSMITRELIERDSYLLFIDDGSQDGTWRQIVEFSEMEPCVQGISLSRNFGHQNAVLGGLMECRAECDISISIDCDGQDDLNAMVEMVEKYLEGYEVVYGVRNDRSSDSKGKRVSAELFYRLMQKMGVDIQFNHADYRLISSKALNQFAQFGEVNLFLRGMVPLVGFPHTIVYYKRNERIAGKSHYPLRKMIGLAITGITSLSIQPVRLIFTLGALLFGSSFIWMLALIVQLLQGVSVNEWTCVSCMIALMESLTLMAVGVVGEYVGKTYMETKRRPRYIVANRIKHDGRLNP